MKKIRAYVSYNERLNKKYYNDFEVINELPKVGDDFNGYDNRVTDIQPVSLDCEQGNDEVWNYDFYKILTFNEKDKRDTPDDWECEDSEYENEYLVCVKKEEDEE